MQKRACRIILGREYLNFQSSVETLKIQPFEQRVTFNQAIFMFKVVNNLLPEYICEMFEKKISSHSDTSNYVLRSNASVNFYVPLPHSETFKNSLAYTGGVLWNNLPVGVKSASSVAQFKSLYLNSPGT